MDSVDSVDKEPKRQQIFKPFCVDIALTLRGHIQKVSTQVNTVSTQIKNSIRNYFKEVSTQSTQSRQNNKKLKFVCAGGWLSDRRDGGGRINTVRDYRCQANQRSGAGGTDASRRQPTDQDSVIGIAQHHRNNMIGKGNHLQREVTVIDGASIEPVIFLEIHFALCA